jgi:hypothetical protein
MNNGINKRPFRPFGLDVGPMTKEDSFKHEALERRCPNVTNLKTRLSGNFRLLVVEERMDRRGNVYLVAENGWRFVPVDNDGVPVLHEIFGAKAEE